MDGEWYFLPDQVSGSGFEVPTAKRGWKVWNFPRGILSQLLEQWWRGETGRKKPRRTERAER